MDILVTGGSGFVGSNLCTELAERGHAVTALSRSPEPGKLPDGVETVSGDVSDYHSIADHFEGQDLVVNLVALSPLFKPKGGDRMHEVVHLEGTRNVVRAAEAHAVSAILQMSALDADPHGPTAYIKAKGRAEDVVRDSDLAWTIFRPSVIYGDGGEFVGFTKQLTTPYVTALPGGGKTRFQPIWIGDLVPMLADAVEDDAHRGEIYELGGPETLSLREVTELAYRAEGRPVTVLSIPMALAGVGLSLVDSLSFVPFGRDQYRSLQFDNTTDNNDADAFGRSPEELRSLSDYLGVS